MKSYNIQALRGDPHYTDDHFQQDMSDAGYDIPDAYKYTPRVATHVMDQIYSRNLQDLQGVVNPATSQNYTPDEAKAEATKLRDQSYHQFKQLM